MTVRLLLLGLALAALPALAQSGLRPDAGATDAYHRGAQLYVDGELGPAEAAVRDGLRRAPDDAKLQALLDLITQDQDEQDGDQNQDSDGDSGDDGEQQEQGEDAGEAQDDASGEQDPRDGQSAPDDPETERDGTDQRPGPGQNDDAPQDPSAGRPGEGGPTPAGRGSAQPGQMSRAQAEQLLDAVGGDEQLLMREMRRFQTRSGSSDKDW